MQHELVDNAVVAANSALGLPGADYASVVAAIEQSVRNTLGVKE